MTEDLLHYIWRFQRFKGELSTTEGKVLEIKHAGMYNTNAGPDFLEAKVRIGSTLWAGNVEVHLRSSDWFVHKHHLDKAYDNIILHVVYEHDKDITDRNGNEVQTLELKDQVDEELLFAYQRFIKNKDWIPCAVAVGLVDGFIVSNWLENVSFERLQNKVEDIFRKLDIYKNNWEQVFYETIARNFGFNLYAEPFELLAKSLPMAYIARHKNNLFQLEALLFGQAGFLKDTFKDDYPNKLKEEYDYMAKKFGLQPIEKHLWKFLRNRPANFPTIRIAQFAYLLHRSSALFSKIIECESLGELRGLFDFSCSDYWKNHYTFDVLSPYASKKPGKTTINLLLINTIVPFVFAYGKQKDDEVSIEKALDYLDELPAEKNFIITNFTKCGLAAKNARQSQAMIQLYKYYCLNKFCLRCSIGDQILKPGKQILGYR
jgi:hypothetical protein